MQHVSPHTHHPIQHLLHPSDYYMPGHGLGAHEGHDRYAAHTVAMFRSGFLFSFLLTLPIVLWAPLFQRWFVEHAPVLAAINLIPSLLGIAVFYYGGQIFLRCAYRELRDHQPGTMVLIATSLISLFLYSTAVTLGVTGHAMWRELSTLITLLLLCHWFIMSSIIRTQGAINQRTLLLPETALLESADGQLSEITLSALQVEMRIVIPPGHTLPADGHVLSGESTIDESLLTGAAQPVTRRVGDQVFAGTRNGESTLHVVIDATGDDTALQKGIKLLETARHTRSGYQVAADHVAAILTIAVVAAACFTLLGWLAITATFDFTLNRLVTILVIASPHALGLAVPLVITNALARGAESGLLVRNRRGLELAKNIDIVVFDKRGTLTMGQYSLVETETTHALSPKEALCLAAAVERTAHHAVAQAIRVAAQHVEVPSSTNFQVIPSLGVQAEVDGQIVMMGGARMLHQWNIVLPEKLHAATVRFSELGHTVIYLFVEQQPLAAFALTDPIRSGAQEAIATLHRQGIDVGMLTDESQEAAHHFAKQLGIDTVFSGLRHGDRRETIRELKGYGQRVAVISKEVLETSALTLADISIISSEGPLAPPERGDVALLGADPCNVPRLIALSKATYHKMVENIGWVMLYNIVAIGLAVGTLTEEGVLLSPLLAVLLMTISVLFVSINARQLRRAKL